MHEAKRIRLALAAAVLALAATTAPHAAVPLQPRSEEAVAEEIEARLAWAWGELPASLVVAVEDGVVELSGEAPDAEALKEATRIAERTDGVVHVLNRMQVGP